MKLANCGTVPLMGRVRAAFFCLAICSSALFSSCRAPTQVTLELTTDVLCADLEEVQIALAQLGDFDGVPPSAATRRCAGLESAGNRIGDIVVAPARDKTGRFAVQVVAGIGQPTEVCLDNGFTGGCIVARRSLFFQRHASLYLPIELQTSCIDVPCGATETCRDGGCVSATLEDPINCPIPGKCDDSGAVDDEAAMGAGGEGPTEVEPGKGNGAGNGTGGQAAVPVCGNGSVEFPESCDDNNQLDSDGCSSDCREEFLLAAEWAGRLILLDRTTGDVVREFAGAPDSDPFAPFYVLQLPNREVVVANMPAQTLVRFDIKGSNLNPPIQSNGIRDIGIQAGSLVMARSIDVGTFDLADFSLQEELDVGEVFSLNGLAVIDDDWLVLTNQGSLLLASRSGRTAPDLEHMGTDILDTTVTANRRLLVPDFGANRVTELSPTAPTTNDNPLGSPTTTRFVDVDKPVSVLELPDSSWLIATDDGLYSFDPDENALLDEKASVSFRALTTYVGPLQDE